MTENLHQTITPNNYFNPKTFGGIILASDYNTESKGKTQKESQIAKRIILEQKFDYRCKRNIELRNNSKKQ